MRERRRERGGGARWTCGQVVHMHTTTEANRSHRWAFDHAPVEAVLTTAGVGARECELPRLGGACRLCTLAPAARRCAVLVRVHTQALGAGARPPVSAIRHVLRVLRLDLCALTQAEARQMRRTHSQCRVVSVCVCVCVCVCARVREASCQRTAAGRRSMERRSLRYLGC